MSEIFDDIKWMHLVMQDVSRRSWYYPLQKGIYLHSMSGMSVRTFLHEVLQFDDAYIEETVRTIFLNNSPVDDIDGTCLEEGDRLALGSAMPGLVGIVMGRDNPFKSFRDDISAQDSQRGGERKPITVSVKLFSSLAAESGQGVIERGILVDAKELCSFLADRKDQIVDVDGLDGDAFLERLAATEGNVPIKVLFH